MRIVAVVVLAVVACSVVVSAKKTADPKECEVCKKVLGKVSEEVAAMANNKNLEAIEATVSKVCKGLKHPKEKKLCYYVEPIRREVSRPMSNGVPADRICKRLKRSSPEICELQYPLKMDKDVDVSKLRVKQLKKLLAERGVACNGCIEKADFVARVKETAHMEL